MIVTTLLGLDYNQEEEQRKGKDTIMEDYNFNLNL